MMDSQLNEDSQSQSLINPKKNIIPATPNSRPTQVFLLSTRRPITPTSQVKIATITTCATTTLTTTSTPIATTIATTSSSQIFRPISINTPNISPSSSLSLPQGKRSSPALSRPTGTVRTRGGTPQFNHMPLAPGGKIQSISPIPPYQPIIRTPNINFTTTPKSSTPVSRTRLITMESDEECNASGARSEYSGNSDDDGISVTQSSLGPPPKKNKSSRYYFRAKQDILLFQQVLVENPFRYSDAWMNMRAKFPSESRPSDRALRERMEGQLKHFKAKDWKKINKSGTVEEYNLKHELLTRIAALEYSEKMARKNENISAEEEKAKQRQATKERKEGQATRKAAMDKRKQNIAGLTQQEVPPAEPQPQTSNAGQGNADPLPGTSDNPIFNLNAGLVDDESDSEHFLSAQTTADEANGLPDNQTESALDEALPERENLNIRQKRRYKRNRVTPREKAAMQTYAECQKAELQMRRQELEQRRKEYEQLGRMFDLLLEETRANREANTLLVTRLMNLLEK